MGFVGRICEDRLGFRIKKIMFENERVYFFGGKWVV